MHSKAACAHLKRMKIIIKVKEYDFPAYIVLVLDGRCVSLCYTYSVLFPPVLFFLVLSLSLSLVLIMLCFLLMCAWQDTEAAVTRMAQKQK